MDDDDEHDHDHDDAAAVDRNHVEELVHAVVHHYDPVDEHEAWEENAAVQDNNSDSDK
jgi:hypothetical protein